MSNLNENEAALELEGLDQALWDAWEAPVSDFTPPPRGVYEATIVDKRDVTIRDGTHIDFVVDYMIQGGDYDGRRLTFMRFSSQPRERFDGVMTSGLVDVLKAAGVSRLGIRTAGECEALIDKLIATQAKFRFTWDWRGFCTHCFETALMASTKQSTVELAKAVATPKHLKDARTAATLKGERAFPLLPSANGAKPTRQGFTQHKCGEVVKAQGQIGTYIVPKATAAPKAQESYN